MATVSRDTTTDLKHVYPQELQVTEWDDKLGNSILKVKTMSPGNCAGIEMCHLDILIKQNCFKRNTTVSISYKQRVVFANYLYI